MPNDVTFARFALVREVLPSVVIVSVSVAEPPVIVSALVIEATAAVTVRLPEVCALPFTVSVPAAKSTVKEPV